MPSARSSFTVLNLPLGFSLPVDMRYFTLPAGSNTDLWRKPPNEDTLTAPIVFASLQNPFIVVEVTIRAEWEMKGDQGGLVIFAGDAPTQSLPSCKWVKAGMETSSSGIINVTSVSATSDGADRCSLPLDMSNITSLRIKFERVGYSLWIWYQIPSLSPEAITPEAAAGTWRELREVTGFFYRVEDKCVHAGVYASRPTNIQQGDSLVVEFEDLEIFL